MISTSDIRNNGSKISKKKIKDLTNQTKWLWSSRCSHSPLIFQNLACCRLVWQTGAIENMIGWRASHSTRLDSGAHRSTAVTAEDVGKVHSTTWPRDVGWSIWKCSNRNYRIASQLISKILWNELLFTAQIYPKELAHPISMQEALKPYNLVTKKYKHIRLRLLSKCVLKQVLKMLVLSRRQDWFRRIESLLSSPITVQRMVHCQWQTQKSSALISNTESDGPEETAEVSRDSTFPKRVDSLLESISRWRNRKCSHKCC